MPDILENRDCVRRHDPDRFLISLFFKDAVRTHLWALYAFNHEIARTREVVTDTNIGLIRLQWWRDSLAGLYERGETGGHSILEGLHAAIARHNLKLEWFESLLYAREFDLEDTTPGSLDGLCNYADFTHTPLLRLGAAIAGEDAEHPALQPVAMAYALTGLLRAVPFHRAQGRNFIPEGVEICTVRERIENLLWQTPLAGAGRLVRLHHRMTRQYISKISLLNDNIQDIRLTFPPLLRTIGLWIEMWKK